MTQRWYSRPVLFVADVTHSLAFYTGALGFTENWRHAEDGKLLVAEIGRDGCEMILSCQWPEKNGHALTFISLDSGMLDALRTGIEANGVPTRDGHWGYHVLIITDPDGNELYFPYQND